MPATEKNSSEKSLNSWENVWKLSMTEQGSVGGEIELSIIDGVTVQANAGTLGKVWGTLSEWANNILYENQLAL